MDSVEETIVQLDVAQIDLEIRDNGEYGKKGDIYFKLLSTSEPLSSLVNSSNSDSDLGTKNKYLAEINEKFRYIGILSDELSKENLGLNVYSNGDIYLGQWENDKKNGIGYYKYAESIKSQSELYVGTWANGVKEGKGVYLWMDDSMPISDLVKRNFDVAIGTFEDNHFIEGIMFHQIIDQKSKLHQEIYIGKMNKEREKNDLNGILIGDNLMFIGEFKEDQIIQGKMISFSEKENIKIEKVYSYIAKVESYGNIKLNISEENGYIELKKKHNFKSLYEKIEKYYLNVYNVEVNYLDFDAFEKGIIDAMEKIKQPLSFE